MSRFLFLLIFVALPGLAAAEKRTVCTITVNSSDEKEAFRRYLPKGDYQFVELVEKGRPDWLASACRQRISCDVLVVSGHFNAGETFYSDKIDVNDFLKVDELERASCSDSCPALFSHLKEVYLFGCESLNPDATRYSSSYGESGRERMRRIFGNVPVIYGFSSAAPVGPAAASLISRYLASGATHEIGSGHPSSRLLGVFGKTSMVAVSGIGNSGRAAEYRHQVCQFFDERLTPAQKVRFIHGLLQRDSGELRLFFDRIERLLAALSVEDRNDAAFLKAIDDIAADRASRSRYLAFARGQAAEVRARMIKVAAEVGWLDAAAQRAEIVAVVNDMLARGPVGFADVDLICALNNDRALDAELPRLRSTALSAANVGQAALLACMGSAAANRAVVRALASPDDREVQIAQAYLRYRPVENAADLKGVAREIARMGAGGAQIRALDTIARLNIADREILEELTRAFAAAKSLTLQRSIAEVFIRSDPKAIPKPELATVLRQHRLRAPDHREDIIDALIRKLGSG